MRCGPDGKVRVYRTKNAGRSWEPLTKGLPQKSTYETVLRDGMAADSLNPVGLYFGTRSGKIYGSANEGNSWQLIADGLPAITCVKAVVVAERRAVKTATRRAAVKRAPARKAALRARPKK